jgi:hypothetical protein
MKSVQIQEGYVAFPQRTSLAIALSFFLGLVTQTAGFAWYASKLDSRVGELEAGDQRLLIRGNERYNELIGRVVSLEKDRDRLARVEEQVKGVAELLREIKIEIRNPPLRPR